MHHLTWHSIRQILFGPLHVLITRFADAVDEAWDLDDPLLAD